MAYNLFIGVTKPHKATQIRVDMCDKHHVLFNIKYINKYLQIIKRTFIKKQPKSLISTVPEAIGNSFGGIL